MEPDETRSARTSFILLQRYRQGDDAAAEALFSRYFQRLTLLARSRLSARLARRLDPEDVVLSVYRSFFIDARAGRFTLGKSGDLWRLLAAITKHKLLRQARHHGAERRSVDRESPLDEAEGGCDFVRGQEPSPEDAVALADELERVLLQLDPFGRRVLELRLQGAQLAEIADDTGRSERTVRRTLGLIRQLLVEQWTDLLPQLPARREAIRSEPARVDAELRVASAVPRVSTARTPGPTALEGAVGPDPGVPWFSHQDIVLRQMIGSGRTGKVYEAWQPGMSRTVAVKYLRKSFLDQPGVVQRFIAEAGIIARLRHPNIVGIHGFGRTPAGAYFFIMELVAGGSLDAIIRTGPIAVPDAVQWVVETCQALEHAHTRGIIHCDLKPANLLLDRDRRIVVTDFGLARSLTGPTPWTTEIEGTAPYMAPEQASRFWGPIDVRTDVYGVGAVLFALLTGRPPWVGRRLPDILADVISATPVPAPIDLRPDLPQSISDICRKCLSKAQDARYPTVSAIRAALTS